MGRSPDHSPSVWQVRTRSPRLWLYPMLQVYVRSSPKLCSVDGLSGAKVELSAPSCMQAATVIYEPHCLKTCLKGFRPGQTQTRLYNCILNEKHLSADLTKESFGHFSSIFVIKISKTSKICIFCMFLQESRESNCF